MKRIATAMLLAGGLFTFLPAVHADKYPADNSGKNVRDRDSASLTPGDQSNAKPDVKLTQQIRRAVVADKSLSMKAHNIKIITADGVVTLRGPVKSAKEKARIDAKAKRLAGTTHVDNQLEIAAH